MPLEERDLLDKFAFHMGQFSWFEVLYRYNDKHLIVMDTDLIEKTMQARKFEFPCITATPENYEEKLTKDITKILVYCRKGELALVKKLAAKHPELAVTSGTYGFAQTGRDRYPRMVPFKPHTGPGKSVRPLVVMSTASADAEFVIQSMHKNGAPHFNEYFGRPLISWLRMHQNFQVSRFFDGVAKRFGKGGTLPMLVQGDVLDAMFANTKLSEARFFRFLQRSGAKVLLIKRHDRLFQSIVGQLMDRTFERSVWNKRPNRKLTCKFRTGDFAGGLERYNTIVKQEALLDRVAEAGIETQSMYLEDFVDNQAAGLANLAEFFDFSLSSPIHEMTYGEGYEEAKHIPPAYYRFRQEFLDRAGYHVPPIEKSFGLE